MCPTSSLAPLAGLAPVTASDTRVIILGSFPGEASLAAKQYYAHPRNQFWPLMSSLLNENLKELSYEKRLDRLLQHRIGLWDVIAACERKGSLDSAIRKAQVNQFEILRQYCPALFRVCFNGKTSGMYATLFEDAGYEVRVLPSSSPANRQKTFDEKLEIWKNILS
ncbi:MAG: DNA-deoxyinosine glycosylase [Paucimonas sp.]|jgi:hypoxanthine-DNA glycosylase|nr:DNA-deoxyinosine glycosylase [Paucimonas sp.]